MAEESRLKMALEKFVQQTIPGVDYLAQYPGTIVAQSGQTFDFQPDSPKVPGVSGLKFYSGFPGVTLTVDPSKSPRAVLFFENGDPGAPALAFFGNPGLQSLVIGPLVSAQPAAREGDMVSVTFTMADAALILTGASPGAPCSSAAPFTLTGTITSGSAVIEIG